MTRFIMTLDQGTTGTTVLIVDEAGAVVAKGYREFPQIFPVAGWVEHNPEDIWDSTVYSIAAALETSGIEPSAIAAIGITNQRETTVVWDRRSLQPTHNAIVWQCRRTADLCATLKAQGLEAEFKEKTGLVLDPYFSGTKLAWLLTNSEATAALAACDQLCFGTIDSYLVAKLTGGEVHVTDVSNASRTLLLNIKTLEWDERLLAHLEIPASVLPRVCGNAEVVGETRGVPGLPDGIPVAGMAGDQQAALFGQICFDAGEAKCTFGTGAFMLTNIGDKPLPSSHGLLTTVAWTLDGRTSYAFEGSAFIAGAAVQWLRDGLKIISSAPDVEGLAASVDDSGGVVFVPALTGLGAPHWRPEARGAILGLTRGSTDAHLARAVLEGIALQNMDIMRAMEEDLGDRLAKVRVDGGAAANDLLMQIQADLLDTVICRPRVLETTGLGAAFLAGLGAGLWKGVDDLREIWQLDREFAPQAAPEDSERLVSAWRAAVEKA